MFYDNIFGAKIAIKKPERQQPLLFSMFFLLTLNVAFFLISFDFEPVFRLYVTNKCL